MKKLLAILLGTVLVLSLAACGAKKDPQQPTTEPETESVPEAEKPEDSGAGETSGETEEIIEPSDPIMVADAARYRGIVSGITKEAEYYSFTLTQFVGTNHGAPSINVTVGENAKGNYPVDKLRDGDYVEVYYGSPIEAGIDESLDAIAYNYLDGSEDRNYNGIVVEVMPNPDKAGEGSILMTDLDGVNQMVVNYNSNGETQFSMSFADVQPGVKLNVFHNSQVTASMPPQVFATEIRKMYEAE